MKTLIRTAMIVTLLMLTLNVAQAQIQATEFDVNGLVLGNTYTKAQVIAKLGEPIKYEHWTEDEGTLGEEFTYTNAVFAFTNNGEFNRFSISDTKFLTFSGQVKVGDPLSKIQGIANTKYVAGSSTSQLWLNNADDPINFNHANGVITCIHGFLSN